MFAVVLALVASLSYGAGDFLAGSQTRRTSALDGGHLQPSRRLILMALVVLVRGQAPPEEVLLPALGAGLLWSSPSSPTIRRWRSA